MIAQIAHYAPTALIIDGLVFLLALAAWLTRSRWWGPAKPDPASTSTGRHRLEAATDPYRPHCAPPVIPGPGPLTDDERRARAIPMPVTEPAWRSSETSVIDVPMPPAPDATALRLADSDRTFLATVATQPVASPDPFAAPTPSTPDAWFGVPADVTRKLIVAL